MNLLIPPRTEFQALYHHANGWCAQLRTDESWDVLYGVSAISGGHPSPQAAIDAAYEKFLSHIAVRKEGMTRYTPTEVNPSVFAALGDIDL